ncbi:MAG: STAS domain-containing protein [Candidatus Promineifilaceae bacterium]
MELSITDRNDGILHLVLSGRLDIAGTGEIESKFTFQTATKKTAVLVDLSEVTFIASIGMRLLLSNARAQKQRGGLLVLYNPQPLVKDALITAGFEQLIPMFDDFDAACQALQTAVTP